MNDKIFFSYYIPALKQAFEEDNINYVFLVKQPSWFYPDSLRSDLESYEDSHYLEYPILEKVAYYFDAKSHGFDMIDNTSIQDYKKNLILEMQILINNNFTNKTKDLTLKFYCLWIA